jgi:hypothetical protein
LPALSTVLLTLASAALGGAPASADELDRISAVNPVGHDISYPQCTASGWNGEAYVASGATSVPMGSRFGIVGVNGGTAAKANPCLPAQLAWATTLPGLPNQPRLQLYVNTANPGAVLEEYAITTWPLVTESDNPYNAVDGVGERCTVAGVGVNNAACSWQYGWERAEWAAGLVEEAADVAEVTVDLAATVVWLDVETSNTWQAGADGLENNAAALEGMTARYTDLGARVGLYSTSLQWGFIVGDNVGVSGNLAALDSWIAGATNLKSAGAFCDTKSALTAGGSVTLAQYVARQFDYDVSCADRP